MTSPAGSLRALWRASIWHPHAIDVDNFKRRWTLRVWVPAYLITMILAGRGVIVSGSPVLDRVFDDWLVDTLGWVLLLSAATALLGVIFRVWLAQIIGMVVIIGMAGTYAASLLVASESTSSRDFLAWLVLGTVWMPLSQLTELGEDIKESTR